jgi:hypothetical protein
MPAPGLELPASLMVFFHGMPPRFFYNTLWCNEVTRFKAEDRRQSLRLAASSSLAPSAA